MTQSSNPSINPVPPEPDDFEPLPQQEQFYRAPARFGSIPVEAEPKGWDRHEGFRKHYPRINLPTQIIERVSLGHPELPEPNRLIWGDNLHVMRQIQSNSIDLIYIDPPFFSGREYNVIWGDNNELRSFDDIWEGGLDGYLIWLNARLYEMKRLLKSTGSIYVHCDWHASHYIKVEMDKIFGYENLINEIVWYYTGAAAKRDRFARKHDVLLWYSKSAEWSFNVDDVRTDYAQATKERFSHYIGNVREGGDFGTQQLNPKGKHPDDVFSISIVAPSAKQRIGYPTQKPVVSQFED